MIDIEPVTLGISLVAIIAFISPIYLHVRKQNKVKKQQHKIFMNHATVEGLHFVKSDFWRNLYAIGLDESSSKVLYIKFEPTPIIELIDLKDVQTISLHKESHQVGSGKTAESCIDKLWLQVIYKETAIPHKSLEFYDGDRFSDHLGEWPLLQQWEKYLSPKLVKTIETPIPKQKVLVAS